MAVDPNVYALSIQLSLDTSDAFTSLDQFATKASDIESTVSEAAKNSINMITGMVDSMTSHLQQSVTVLGEFMTATNKITDDLTQAFKISADSRNLEEDSLEDLEEKLRTFEEIDKLQEDMQKALEAEQKTGQKYLELLQEWVSTIGDKNDLHIKERKLVETESAIVGKMGGKWKDIKDDNITIDQIYGQIRATVNQIWSGIKKYAEETEKFVTANYRAYGSQQDLIASSRFLAARYGILRDKAIEAYAILGNTKAPRDEIDKLAKSIAGASRYTGVGIEQLAQYAFRMRQVRFDANMMEKQLRFVAEAMRKFGLSTADVNKILSDTGLSASTLETIFKGEDQAAKYDRLRLSIAGLAKQMGYAAEVSETFFKNLEDPIKRALFEDYAGQTINSVEDMQVAIAKAGKRVRAEIDEINNMVESGAMDSKEAQMQLQIMAETYGFGSEQAMQMAASLDRVAEEMGLNLENAQDFEKAMQKLIDEGVDPLSEANNTLTAQLQILKSNFGAMAGAIMQLVENAILPLIKALNYVISIIIEIASWIGAAIGFLEKWVPGFKLLTAVIKFLGGAIVAVGLAAAGAVAAITSFAFSFAYAAKMINRAISIVEAVIRSILSLAGNIATAIQTILAGIGRGFAALGAAIAPVSVPLMQFGAAVMMVGAALLFMGVGLYYASQSGWEAVAMLTVLSFVLIGVVAALAGLSTVVAPAIPVMYALAIAMTIFGAAAALVGLSMFLIGKSLQSFAKYGGKAAEIMPELAVSIAIFGVAALASSFGIAALGFALGLLIVPMKLIGENISKVDQLIKSVKNLLLSSEQLKSAFLDLIDVGEKLFYTVMTAIVVFGLIATVLAPAIPQMLLLSAVMLVLGAAMALAGYGIKSVGEAVQLFAIYGANAAAVMPELAFGIMALAAAGILGSFGILALGFSLRYLVAPLKVLGESMSQVTNAIEALKNLAASIGQIKAAIAELSGIATEIMRVMGQMVSEFAQISISVAPMIPSMLALAFVMLILGAAIYYAGQGLSLISTSLESFATYGAEAAAIMPDLANGVIKLASVGILGALGIAALGLALMVLAVPLKTIADSMGKMVEVIQSISVENLVPAARGLYEASVYFLMAAANLVIAGPALAHGALAIAAASLILGFAAPLLLVFAAMYNTASQFLLNGSINMITSAIILMAAGDLLIAAIDNINGVVGPLMSVAASLMVASAALLLASAFLLPGAIGIFVGMSWLELATSRFKRSIDDIERIGRGMRDFADAFGTISRAPIDSIGNAVQSGLDAIPGINQLATELERSAALFSKAADKFTEPVDRISNSLNALGSALSQVGAQGLNFQADMDKVGAMLEKYSELFEGAAQRIEIAVAANAQPAMATAREEGLDNIAKAEGISTVKVMTNTDGGAEMINEDVILLQEQTQLLRNISERLDILAGGKGTELAEIVELLEAYLPSVAVKDEGLSTEFNQWMK